MPTFFLGPLTRYYAETGGVGDLRRETDVEVIAGAVSAWKHWINKELPLPLDWDEAPTAPFDRVDISASDWTRLCDTSDSPQVNAPEMWLPGEHDFLFDACDLRGEMIRIGSVQQLLHECQLLLRLAPDLSVNASRMETLARLALKYALPLVMQD